MTRLWAISDLHLEAIPYPEKFCPRRPEFDVLVAAGDIWEGDCLRSFRFLRSLAGEKPVVFVLGNHEHCNGEVEENLALARMLAADSGVTLLEGDAETIAGCQFVGTTLWTDYRLGGGTDPQAETAEQIDVRHSGGTHLITIGDARRLHEHARARLKALLSGAPKPLVVVTHHAPLRECLPEAIRGTWAAGNSASDLSDLVDRCGASAWIHGHIHHSVDTVRPNGTRIICNPAGPLFSNESFDESLVVTIR